MATSHYMRKDTVEIRKAYEPLNPGVDMRIKIKSILKKLLMIVLPGFIYFWLWTTNVLLRAP